MVDKYLFWFEELGQEHGNLVGRKCANIGEIAKISLPTPPGFALSIQAYKHFMTETNAAEDIRSYLKKFSNGLATIDQFNEASKDIRQIIKMKEIPRLMREMILSNYDDLCQICGVTDIAVSTRSAGTVSRPGQYETFLNVKGESELLDNIKKVWASTFNPRSIAYRVQNGLPIESDPIGVAILKMVNAKAAGVLFTADPNTGDTSKLIIEANWGLGESVVGGEVMPDNYILDKESLEVIDKTLGKKSKYVTFQQVGVAEDDTPFEKMKTFCLSDDELSEIGKLGIILEKHFGVPQDVEWAIDQDFAFPQNIIILQTRTEFIAPQSSPVDQVLDYMVKLF
jgi:pyruvate,water dikinase